MRKQSVLFLVAIFLCFNAHAQQWLKWRDSFHPDTLHWHAAKNGKTQIVPAQGSIAFGPSNTTPLIVKMKELYMDFANDFIIEFTMLAKSPVTFFWNASLDGTKGHHMRLEQTDFTIEEIVEDRSKVVTKGKFRQPLQYGVPLSLKVQQRSNVTTIEVSQRGTNQPIASYRATAFTKQFSVGFKANASEQPTIVLQSFAIHYLPYMLSGIVEIPFFGYREQLPEHINTTADEVWPYVSADGGKLFFHRNDQQESGNVLKYATLANDVWGNPQPQTQLLGTTSYNRIISASEDGNRYYVATKDGEVNVLARDTSAALQTSSLQVPKGIVVGVDASVFVSNSGQILLYSTEQKGGFGGKDLYVTLSDKSGNFGKPINLGAGVNSPGDELMPFLAPDERTLYLSSTGWPGYGEADIYVTKRLDDTWTNWAPIKNMGRSVNTFGFDGYFTTDARGEYGYFASHADTATHLDIFRVAFPRGAGPEPLLLVSGHVRDIKTNKTLVAEVTYKDVDNPAHRRTVTTNGQGFFRFILPENRDYALFAHKETYYPKLDTISLRDLNGYREVTIDLYLTPIEANGIIGLSNIFFEQSRPEILPRSYPELDNLLTTLSENPTMKIRIDGHTDGMGNRQMNINLSKARANAIRDYLLKRGVEASRVRAVGFGPDRPIADNADPELRMLNRRVEFTIIER